MRYVYARFILFHIMKREKHSKSIYVVDFDARVQFTYNQLFPSGRPLSLLRTKWHAVKLGEKICVLQCLISSRANVQPRSSVDERGFCTYGIRLKRDITKRRILLPAKNFPAAFLCRGRERNVHGHCLPIMSRTLLQIPETSKSWGEIKTKLSKNLGF